MFLKVVVFVVVVALRFFLQIQRTAKENGEEVGEGKEEEERTNE